ncbi:molecular chaperone DnaJ [Cellulosilyticum sp. I15G10I2]|uniref:molecular chaperone DnaJ n=1 Tax=Cellulosilyticum sp. I15G10I2 TaxID=1892843 RepID=UPI00085C7170|nr:molecular chaperone DnaJ [Cellulosilyticum sp. I15G10I2]
MILNETIPVSFYEEIRLLIKKGKLTFAEAKLNTLTTKTDQWHYLYSLLLIHKTWFDSARDHLQIALSMAPDNAVYQEALTQLMGRYHPYSNDYYRSPYSHRRRGCCCCCCDDCCCHFSCCDLICLDSCCECMGGDLIECI